MCCGCWLLVVGCRCWLLVVGVYLSVNLQIEYLHLTFK
jgi:hypothetical protein